MVGKHFDFFSLLARNPRKQVYLVQGETHAADII